MATRPSPPGARGCRATFAAAARTLLAAAWMAVLPAAAGASAAQSCSLLAIAEVFQTVSHLGGRHSGRQRQEPAQKVPDGALAGHDDAGVVAGTSEPLVVLSETSCLWRRDGVDRRQRLPPDLILVAAGGRSPPRRGPRSSLAARSTDPASRPRSRS
jgi:hypothetical protein